MTAISLLVSTRDVSQKAKYVRAAGRIPAVYYGHNQKNQFFDIGYQEFIKVFKQVGESAIIDLTVDDKAETKKVLVHDIQYDPLTGDVTHIDFIHVDMKEAITTHIPLEFVGVAPAVKDKSGILTVVKSALEVKCLPQYLVAKFQVDISGLLDFHSVIHIKDLNLPKEITILHDPEDTVVTVSMPAREEEAKPAATAPVEGEVAAGSASEKGAETSTEKK